MGEVWEGGGAADPSTRGISTTLQQTGGKALQKGIVNKPKVIKHAHMCTHTLVCKLCLGNTKEAAEPR